MKEDNEHISDELQPKNDAKSFTHDNYFNKISNSRAPLVEIKGLQFTLLDPNHMMRLKSEKITKSSVNCKGAPVAGSINSSSMGPTDRNGKCETCQMQPCECDGQFGMIDIAYPVYNVLFFDRIIKILKCVCPWCSRLLVDKNSAQFKHFIATEKDPKERLKLLEQASARITVCDVCPPKKSKKRINSASVADTVEELAGVDESTMINNNNTTTTTNTLTAEEQEERRIRLQASGCCGGVQFSYQRQRMSNDIWRRAKANDGEFIKNKNYYISPAQVLNILSNISDEDIRILGSHPEFSPPKHMILTVLPVPPKNIRQVVIFNNGSRKKTENPFNTKLQDIQRINEELFKARRDLIKRCRSQFADPVESLLNSLNIPGFANAEKTDSLADSLAESPETADEEEEEKETEKETETGDYDEEKKIADEKLLYDENEISKKTRSTLTAILRSKKSHNKAVAKKEHNQLQLKVEDGELVLSTTSRSGDATISDEEWTDYLRYDCAHHETTRWAVDYLQALIGGYFKEDTPPPPHNKKHPLRTHGNNRISIRSRLKGKYALVRGAGMAKRNDFSMRGVITPNPDLDIDELNMPECRARDVTIPEVVTEMNIEIMRRLVMNGPKHYCGKNFITHVLFLLKRIRIEFL